MKRTITLGAAVAALAASASPALASSFVAESYEDILGGLSYRVAYTAAAGETNQVTASYDAKSRTFTLTDAGVRLIEPEFEVLPTDPYSRFLNCRYTFNRVTCTDIGKAGYNALDFELELGDGDDTATMSSSERASIDGGAGDDTLTHGGLGRAILIGGEGHDTVRKTGGGGADLHGDEGDDVLVAGAGGSYLSGGPGADALNGGTGLDHAVLSDSNPSPDGHTGVSVTFDGVANDGMPGEGDNVADAVESVGGTRLADTMTGDERPQELIGSEGDDVLDGGGGDDHVSGNQGDDHVTGGPGVDWLTGGNSSYWHASPDGDDVIDARDGGFDRYACGNGTDRVLADAGDAFEYAYSAWQVPDPAECETVEAV